MQISSQLPPQIQKLNNKAPNTAQKFDQELNNIPKAELANLEAKVKESTNNSSPIDLGLSGEDVINISESLS